MKKLFATLACVSTLAFAGAAAADEPMRLGDTALDSVTAAGMVNFQTDVTKNVNINGVITLDVDKNVASFVDVFGNLATAEASADALGLDTLAETETFSQVIQGEASYAFSQSIAASAPALIAPQ